MALGPRRHDAGRRPHRYREANGVQTMVMLRSMAINALRLNGICSVTEGIAALAHDIKGLLRLMGCRETAEPSPLGSLPIGLGLSSRFPCLD